MQGVVPCFSLLLIPSDVLLHHVFAKLSPLELFVLTFVSLKIKKMLTDRFEKFPIPNKKELFRVVLRQGTVGLLLWFQRVLCYPKLKSELFRQFLPEAVKGLQHNYGISV